MGAHGLYDGLYAAFAGGFVDVLIEEIFHALASHVELAHKGVAAMQRGLIGYLYAAYDGVDTFVVHLLEGGTGRCQKFVARMFEIVQVVGIIDNALQVDLVIAYFEFEFKNIGFFHRLRVVARRRD